MLMRTNIRDVENSYSNVISVLNGKLDVILRSKEPIAFTADQHGWTADVFDFGDTAIVMGRQPFGNITADPDLCKKYERLARNTFNNSELSINDRIAVVEELLDMFVSETIKSKIPEIQPKDIPAAPNQSRPKEPEKDI